MSQKVSRERVGTELEGMLYGPAPVEAVRLLERLSLFQTVFSLPEDQAVQSQAAYVSACRSCMEAAYQLSTSLGLQLDKEESRFLLLAALLLPLRQLQVRCGDGGERVTIFLLPLCLQQVYRV